MGTVIGQTESLLGDEEADIFHGLAVKLSDGGRMLETPAARIPRITNAPVPKDGYAPRAYSAGAWPTMALKSWTKWG